MLARGIPILQQGMEESQEGKKSNQQHVLTLDTLGLWLAKWRDNERSVLLMFHTSIESSSPAELNGIRCVCLPSLPTRN